MAAASPPAETSSITNAFALSVGALFLAGVLVGLLLPYPQLAQDDRDDELPALGLDPTDDPYAPHIDPASFVENVTNPYFPLIPGTTFRFGGTTSAGHEEGVMVVLAEHKMILGVSCTIVRDRLSVDGSLVEETLDWYAQDADGTVWYMGEDSKEYRNGVVVGTAGSWQAGVGGAQPGVIMFADPLPGVTYRQEYLRGEAEDMATVLLTDGSVHLAMGDYTHIVQTKDFSLLEPDIIEYKYYAPGLGMILEDSPGGVERVELLSVTPG